MNRIIHPHLIAPAVIAVLALTACDTGNPQSSDADWQPARNVTLVVPFGAGGGSDAFGRIVASAIEQVEPELVVTVENREGGSGAVGLEYFKARSGDAQSLLAASTMIPVPDSAFSEFTLFDYTPLASLAEDASSIVTRADAPFDSCAQLIDYAATQRVTAGTPGDFTIDGVVQRLVAQAADVELDNVTFESGGEIVAALLGDQVTIGFLNLGEVSGQLASDDLKALCTIGSERYPYEGFESLPTASEEGIDVALAQFRGIIAPPGITEAQQAYWVDVLERAYATEGFQDYLTANLVLGRLIVGNDLDTYLHDHESTIAEVVQ